MGIYFFISPGKHEPVPFTHLEIRVGNSLLTKTVTGGLRTCRLMLMFTLLTAGADAQLHS